jgi:hypothetical protein
MYFPFTSDRAVTNDRLALVAVVPKDKLTINGPTKSWAGKGSSGKAVHRIFCSECGSPIAHDPDAAPEIIALKAGTLDTEIKKTLKPVCIADLKVAHRHGDDPHGFGDVGLTTFFLPPQDTEIWTQSKLPFCQEHLEKPFEGMPH